MDLKKLVCAVLLGLLILSVAGCSGSGQSAKVVSGRTAVTLSFGQMRTADPEGPRVLMTKSIPASILKLKIVISAPDMVPIVHEVSTVGRDAISESIDVPNGPNRLFSIEALDAEGIVLYKGQTYADLTGSPVALTISMVSSDPLPPVFGGVAGITGITQTSVILSWPQSSDSVTPPEKIQYLIYMATEPGKENFGSPAFTTLPGQTSFEVSGLSPGRTYYFVVRAMDEMGNIDTNTVEIPVSTLQLPDSIAPVFGGLTSVNAVSPSEVVLSWTSASDNESPASDIVYLVYMAVSSGGENMAVPNFTTSPGVNSFTIGGLTEGTTYYFIVRARDKAGNIDGNSVERSAGIQDQTPPQFGGLSAAVAASPTNINLTWTGATDNVSQPMAISYLVYVAAVSGGQDFTKPLYTTQQGSTFATLSGMSPGSRYYIVVRARDAAGNTDANTVEKSVLMPFPQDTTPPAFGGLVSASASATTVTLSWNTATDSGGVAGYNIYAATAPGAQNYSVATMTAPSGSTSITYAAPNGGTTYYFVVRARDAAGNIDGNTTERSATTDIFVSASSGNDTTGAGTAASPWRTITKALAVSAGKPGLTINAAGGTHNAAIGEIFPLNFSATTGRTLNCTPSGPLGASGTMITSAGSGQSAVFGGPNTTIRNCTITGDSATAGIYHNGGNISVQNCIINGNGATLNCLELGNTESVTGSTIMNCTQFGIVVSLAGNPTISGNIISGNSAGIQIWNTSAPFILNNTIRSNQTGISSSTTGKATINGNSVYGNIDDGIVFTTATATGVSGNSICNNTTGVNINYSTSTPLPTINNNRIFLNASMDLSTFAQGNVNARNNSWDSAPPSYFFPTCSPGADICNFVPTFPTDYSGYGPPSGATCP